MDHSKLKQDNIFKLFISNSIPAIISMVIAGTQGVIDGIFLGKFAGINSMASVNIVHPFTQLIFALSFVVCSGAISKMGRSLGENKDNIAQSVLRTSSLFVTILSIIFVIIAVLFNRPISKFLGASENLIDDAADYILYFSLFTPIISNMFLFGFTDRIISKPNQYLFATITSVIVNITLNYIFIAKLKLGVKGAAIASGLADFASLLICIIPLLNKKNILNLFTGKINFSLMPKICYNGSSEAVSGFATALTVYLFNSELIKIAGDGGVAAFSIINYIATFSTVFMFGVSDGISPIISYNYGAEKFDRVKKTLFLAFVFNFIAGIIIFVLIFIFAKDLIMLFNNADNVDYSIVNLATNGAKIYSISFIIIGFNLILSGFYTSIGNGLYSIIIALTRSAIGIIIGIKLLPLFFGIDGVWLSATFAEALCIIVCIFLSIKALKKAKRIKKISERCELITK